jgi:hypothetical protein
MVTLFLGIVVLSPWGLVAGAEDGKGTIRGSLTNGTTGEQVSGVEVALQRYQGEQEKEKQTTISDSQGNFLFGDLERGEGTGYSLQIIYKGVEYYSPILMFPDQETEIPFDMAVYETTDSDKEISILRHHVLLEPGDGALWVREMMIVENRGNRVFVGTHEIATDKKETLRISLPPRAEELQLLRGLMSCCVVDMEDGFADTMDIKPGRKEVLFAYKVGYNGSRLDLSKRINMKTDSLDFFVPDRGIKVEGENVTYAGLIGEPGKQFLRFSGSELARGGDVVLTLKGFPWGRRFLKNMIPIVGVALIALGLVYPLMRRRRRVAAEADRAQESGESLGPHEEREHLLREIARLDDQLDSGEISPDDHEKNRRVLKERAVKMTEALEEANKT